MFRDNFKTTFLLSIGTLLFFLLYCNYDFSVNYTILHVVFLLFLLVSIVFLFSNFKVIWSYVRENKFALLSSLEILLVFMLLDIPPKLFVLKDVNDIIIFSIIYLIVSLLLSSILYGLFLLNKKEKATDTEQFSIRLLPDSPQDDIGQDILGRDLIANDIKNIIYGVEKKTSYTLGLVGEWGSGKTTIINFIKKKIGQEDKNDIVFINFSPWNYNRDTLISSFFDILSDNIPGLSHLLLRKYIQALGIKDSYGIFDFLKSFICSDISEIKSKIENKLELSNKKYVVIIDDLDRCEPDEVMLILNLVKNIGSLHNLIYLLSYDKLHIKKVLEFKGYDEHYIEKIINYEKIIGINTEDQLKNFFLETLRSIVGDRYYNDDPINKDLINALTMTNLRFIKKVLNSFLVDFFILTNNFSKDIIKRIIILQGSLLNQVNGGELRIYFEGGNSLINYSPSVVQSNTQSGIDRLESDELHFLGNIKISLLNDLLLEIYIREKYSDIYNKMQKKEIFEYTDGLFTPADSKLLNLWNKYNSRMSHYQGKVTVDYYKLPNDNTGGSYYFWLKKITNI